MNEVFGTWPAEVAEYDAEARMCRVRVPGITDGSSVLPLAEIRYPIGDRSDAEDSKDHTELRILPGDMVYVEFLCGDPRFPLITGHRLKRAGNPTGWRRWRHENIEMTADGDMVLNARNLILNVDGNMTTTVGGKQDTTAGTSTHSSATHKLTAATTIAGSIATTAGPGGAGAKMQGPVEITGGSVTHNNTNIGATHTHTERGDGADVSPPH